MRAIWLLLGTGCMGWSVPLDEKMPEILGLEPAEEVPWDASVALILSVPPDPVDDVPISVFGQDGRPLFVQASLEGARILLTPQEPWPPAEELTVALDEGLSSHGRSIPSGRFGFRTQAAPPVAPSVVLVAPSPHSLVPYNLKTLVVVAEPPISENVARMARLVSEDENVALSLVAHHDGMLQYRVASLRPNTQYNLEIPEVVEGAYDDPRYWVHTSSMADHVRPALTSTRSQVLGVQASVWLTFSEPVQVQAELRSTARRVPLKIDRLVGEQIRLTTDELTPRTSYTVVMSAEDCYGNRSGFESIMVQTGPQLALRISELVAAPVRDWGDSEPAGEPFDPFPGDGAVTSADDWVELVNESDGPVDLSAAGLELRILDGSPTITPLNAAPAIWFGSGGRHDRWWPGEALVVRPRGDIAQREVAIEVWVGRQRLARVKLGDPPSSHPGGAPPELEYDALAADASGRWRWCVPSPGDPLPGRICR